MTVKLEETQFSWHAYRTNTVHSFLRNIPLVRRSSKNILQTSAHVTATMLLLQAQRVNRYSLIHNVGEIVVFSNRNSLLNLSSICCYDSRQGGEFEERKSGEFRFSFSRLSNLVAFKCRRCRRLVRFCS